MRPALVVFLLALGLPLVHGPAMAASDRHTIAVSARVLGHCRLDSQAGAATADASRGTDARVTCSRNAARPSILVSPGIAPAPQPKRLVEASPDGVAARHSTLVTVLY